MKGDFSRIAFDPAKHDAAVLLQQGRVLLDADWNEGQAVARHRLQATARDVIGDTGVPKSGGGFAIGLTGDAKDLTISAGRLYVAGQLCVAEAAVQLTTQPDLKPASGGLAGYAPPAASGRYLVYAQVFDRNVTALEDGSIRETALGGPDTTTRLRTVWQVRLASVAATAARADFAPGWSPPEWATTGAMTASTGGASDPDPCILPPSASYRGLENQLYRVEVHQGGTRDAATPPTFKWSRDNASVLTTVTGSGQVLTAADLGQDTARSFAAGQWVEIVDARMEAAARAGQLLRIAQVDASTGQITIDAATPVPAFDASAPVLLRRWDQTGAGASADGVTIAAGPIGLEAGLQLAFAAGSYRAGDYWTIPARTAISAETGAIEWPVDGGGQPLALPPQGPEDHACPLALVDYDATAGTYALVADCRLPFPALTAIQASDVGFDDTKSHLGAVTVQQAIDFLDARNGTDCTVLVRPGDNVAALFATLPAGSAARICFQAGTFALPAGVTLSGLSSVLIQGAGPGTRLVAATAEAALTITGCAAVTVYDLHVEAGQIGFAAKMSGALTIDGASEVHVERVQAVCAAGAAPAAAALCIRSTAFTADFGFTAAWVRDCTLTVGQNQIGLLAVNVSRLVAEANTVKLGATITPAQALANFDYTGALRRSLLRSYYYGKEAAPAGVTNTTLTYNNVVLRFWTDPSLISGTTNDWQTLITQEKPAATTVATVVRYLDQRAGDLLRTSGASALPLTKALIGRLLAPNAQLPAIAQGIVVGGQAAREVRILNNSITDARQGIHVAVSVKNSAATINWVQIENNVIGLKLPVDGVRMRHGIFVGNCRTARIDNNRIDIQKAALAATRPIDGIALAGVVDRVILMRGNHITGATTGINFQPRTIAFAKPQWIISDNAMPSAQRTVFTSAAVQKLVIGFANNFG